MFRIINNVLETIKQTKVWKEEYDFLIKNEWEEIYLHADYKDKDFIKVSEYEKTQSFIIPSEFVEFIKEEEIEDIWFLDMYWKKIYIWLSILLLILFIVWWVSIPKYKIDDKLKLIDEKVLIQNKEENKELKYIYHLNMKIKQLELEKLNSYSNLEEINIEMEDLRKEKYLLTN